MKKFFSPTAALALLAALSLPALAAGNGGSGVVIAVGPQHPAVASVLLGGGAVAPTVHKQSADFGVIATALTRGYVEGATAPADGVSGSAAQRSGAHR
jgi:hypothetical protein